MSQENIDLARKAHAAFSAGDLDGFVEACHSEVEFQPALERGLEGAGGVYRGHEGIREWWRRMQEAWAEVGTEIEEIRDLHDSLIVFCSVRGRAKASGIELEARVAQVMTIRDGKIASSHDYLDQAAALEAVGLRE